MLCGFCSKFHKLSNSAINFENPLRFEKVTESLKVGTFLKTQCSCATDACFLTSGCKHCKQDYLWASIAVGEQQPKKC